MEGVGGWWAAGAEPLPPTPPVLRVRASSRRPLTRDFFDNEIVKSIFKEEDGNEDYDDYDLMS